MFTLLLPLLACKTPAVTDDSPLDTTDPQTDDSGADDSATDDTGDPVDTGPIDRDGDGSPLGEDCDDRNDRVYPGAEEVFDGWDNDCDGVTDANGDYTGTATFNARATYEGERHSFQLSCPFQLSRTLSDFTMLGVCETDPDDAWAQLLLGARLELSPDDPYLWEHEVWTGLVLISSSNGWTTYADGELTWSSLDTTTFTLDLNATWLSMSGGGTLRRAP